MSGDLPQVVTLLEASSILGENYTLTSAKWRERGWRPIARARNTLLFRKIQVERWAKVYRGSTRKSITLLDHLNLRQAAKMLGIKHETLHRRYKIWGVPFYRGQTPPHCIYFVEEELAEWADTPRGKRALKRNRN